MLPRRPRNLIYTNRYVRVYRHVDGRLDVRRRWPWWLVRWAMALALTAVSAAYSYLWSTAPIPAPDDQP